MAVSIRNVEKFIADHPELFTDDKETVLAMAKAVSEEAGIISGGVVLDFMGRRTTLFFEEIMDSPEHVKMGLEDLAKAFG